MATYYINPEASSTGTGTISDPFRSWASVTWSSGNTYLQKAGTVASETVAVGSSGTVGSRIYIGKYDSGPNPIVGNGQQYGVYLNVRQYIDVEDIDARSCTDHGFYVRSGGGSNLQSITFTRCNAYGNQNNGFYLDSIVLNGSINNVTFTDCNSYDNLEHGYDCLGIVKNVIWTRCKAWNNGTVVLGHGFSIHPFISNNITSGWTATGTGTSYSRATSAGEDVQKVINRTSGVTFTKNPGAGATVANGEWDQASAGATLYINNGGDPNGVTMAWKRAAHGPFTYYNCESYNNQTDAGAGEGHGFASDDMTGPSTYYGCYSHNNEGAGFQCQWTDDVAYYGCIAVANVLSNFRTTGHTDTLSVNNCTSVSSSEHGYFFDDPFTDVSITNCIAYKNGTSSGSLYGIIAGTTGVTATKNCCSGNGSTGTNSYNSVTDSSPISADPLLDVRHKPTNARLFNGGATVSGTDFYGNTLPASPSIGAIQCVGVYPRANLTTYQTIGNKISIIGRGRR